MKFKSYIVVLIILASFAKSSKCQIKYSQHFEVSTKDLNRWKVYSDFVVNRNLSPLQIADSLMNFAQVEYELGQFSKTRELCLLAQEYNPKLTSTYLLIGKSYVSSTRICQEGNSLMIKEGIIWAAIDEWEKIDSKSINFEEAKTLIHQYSKYFPTVEHFRNCFGKRKVKEGDEYFVDCWIKRKTKIRLKLDD